MRFEKIRHKGRGKTKHITPATQAQRGIITSSPNISESQLAQKPNITPTQGISISNKKPALSR